MILPTSVNDCDDQGKRKYAKSSIYYTKRRGLQSNLFYEVTPRVSKSMNRVTES